MDHFNYIDSQLYAEQVPVIDIVRQYGTPCYVYSRATFERHWHAFSHAFTDHPHLICYAVKANSNLAVLNILARLGSGFDIVSQGELERVLVAGGDPKKIIFSGVGKSRDAIKRSLEVGIYCFNVESLSELDRINEIAGQLNKLAPVSLRINPNVDARTHPYIATGLSINKFGIDHGSALVSYLKANQMPHIKLLGLDCHIGSQITELRPFLDALDQLILLVKQLEEHGIALEHIDLGGGLGVRYQNEAPPEPSDYATAIKERMKDNTYKIILEPGRAIAANAGILITQVEYLKETSAKNFAIVDAAMNDLMRPALYQAEHEIIPVKPRAGEGIVYDVVGPVCETGDFLGKARKLVIQEGDLLAVRSAGAYGFVLSSNYNSRPKVAEIMVDNDTVNLIGARETIESLYKNEFMI